MKTRAEPSPALGSVTLGVRLKDAARIGSVKLKGAWHGRGGLAQVQGRGVDAGDSIRIRAFALVEAVVGGRE
jgi:hypothetical protein